MKLEDFLRRERALTKWKNNAKKAGKSKVYISNRLDRASTLAFGGAFLWNETPEGLDFWVELNRRYTYIIEYTNN